MDMVSPIGANGVRIDGTLGLDAQSVPEEKAAQAKDLKAGASSTASEQTSGALEMVSSQERLIAAAAACEDLDARAIAEAKALLDSGRLDTSEAARRAAQALLDLGP